jgi:hypothetical protein
MSAMHGFVAGAEALFCSDLHTDSCPSCGEADAAIERAISLYGGRRGCIEFLAQEYGDHPETAAPRMKWAALLAHKLCAPNRP